MLKMSQALATMFLIPPLAVMPVPSMAQSDGDLPRIERRGSASQLIVGGKPFLVLGGELHNSSSSTLSYMQPIWPRLAEMNLNTVLVPVSWEQIEPREGGYDFSLVDGLIRDARKHNLRVGLLWFGTWKNLVSSYAPAWVRRDTQRFPTAVDKAGNKLPILSTFSKEGQAADARAFAALMKHLREIDSRDQTVIMVQVENEVGLGNAERDYSEAANLAFAQEVPKALMAELVRRKGELSRELLGAWTAAGAKTSGTWEQVFGSGAATNEIFMAWNYARYISGVVAEGHAAYRLPLFVNAAIGRQDGRLATYPSGGPLPLVLNIWQAGAPQIGMFTPDIYFGSFADWCAKYTQSGNPLFIPEMRGGAQGAANAFLAIGNYGAIGASPFGIDASLGDKDLTQAYATLKELTPLILSSQPGNMVKAVVLDATNPSGSMVLGDYMLNVQLRRDRRSSETAAQGYALAIAEPGDRFIIAGKDVQVTFATQGGEPRTVGLDVVEEGSFVDGKWITRRRLNGDETMLDYNLSSLAATRQYGTGLRFAGDAPQILRTSLFQIR